MNKSSIVLVLTIAIFTGCTTLVSKTKRLAPVVIEELAKEREEKKAVEAEAKAKKEAEEKAAKEAEEKAEAEENARLNALKVHGLAGRYWMLVRGPAEGTLVTGPNIGWQMGTRKHEYRFEYTYKGSPMQIYKPQSQFGVWKRGSRWETVKSVAYRDDSGNPIKWLRGGSRQGPLCKPEANLDGLETYSSGLKFRDVNAPHAGAKIVVRYKNGTEESQVILNPNCVQVGK